MSLAQDILNETQKPMDAKSLAQDILSGAEKIDKPPEKEPESIIRSDNPVLNALGAPLRAIMPAPPSWEDYLAKQGVNPASQTVGQDVLESLSVKKQAEHGLIGVGRGFVDRKEGVEQLGMEIKHALNSGVRLITGQMADTEKTAAEMGKEQAETQQFHEKVLADRKEFDESRVGKTDAAKVGRVMGGTAPILAVPAPGGIIGGSALIGAAERGTAYIPPGGDRVDETLKGAAVGAGAGLAIRGAVGGANAVTGRGLFSEGKGPLKISPEKADLVRKARSSDLQLDPLFLHQELGNHPILNRLASQAGSSSTTFREALESQLRSGALSYQKLAKELSSSQETAGAIILKEARKGYEKALGEIEKTTSKVEMRGAGNALKEAVKNDYIRKSQAEVSRLYNDVERFAAEEGPIFNVTETQAVATRFRQGKEAVGLQGEEAFVSAARGQYRQVLDDFLSVSGEQTSYEALKSIRTRLGEIIEAHPPGSPGGSIGGEAKYLYKSLSKDIAKPTNSAPNFVKANTDASAKALERFEVIGDSDIQKIIATGNEFKLAKMLAAPGGISNSTLKALKEASPERMNTIREYTKANILLDETGSQAALNTWLGQFGDKEALAFFLGNGNKMVAKAELGNLRELAQRIDTLRLGPVGDMAKLQVSQQLKARQALSVMISEKTTPQDIKMFVELVGGEGSLGHKAVISAAYEDFVARMVAKTPSGLETINQTALRNGIELYKKSGVWDILRPIDRTRIEALDAYYSMLIHGGKDVGASLEVAQAITNLKHPATFITGVHQLGMNSVMGKIMMNDKLANIVLGKGKASWQAIPQTKRISAVINAYLDEISPPERKK